MSAMLQHNLQKAQKQALKDNGRQDISKLDAQRFVADIVRSRDIGGQHVDVSETQGERSTQEDTYIAMQTSKRDSHDVPQLLLNQFREMAIRTRHYKSGSTASVAYVSSDGKVTTANTGDSRTSLYIYDKKTGKVSYERLTYDHRPDDKRECERIVASGGKVASDKHGTYWVDNRLAVSRSFGDSELGESITSQPDITVFDVKKYPDSRYELYLCLSCDGLYETLQEKAFAELLQTHLNEGSKYNNIAKLFTDYAGFKGSGDNITALVVEIASNTSKDTSNTSKDIVLGVFDGHGGGNAARALASGFKNFNRSR